MFVNKLLWEIDTTAQLDLPSNSILLTRFGKGPDQQEENSVHMSKKPKWVADVVILRETKALLYKIPFTILHKIHC